MRTVDLFSGCGGMTLGFMRQGFHIEAAFENWDPAINCYRANFHHPVFQRDLLNVNAAVTQIRTLEPDVIIGGPPCQDFSNAGTRVEGARANLTRCFAEIVSGVHPKCFVMENVDRARSSDAYADAKSIFKKAGYGLTEDVLVASYCGVPQQRKRFICFGMLGKEDGFAKKAFDAHLADTPMTVREYFGDSLDIDFYYHHPRSSDARAIYSVDEPSATIRGTNCEMPKTYWKHPHPRDAAPVTSGLRALTYQELARIQTFPEDFKWIGNKSDIEKMIGNAVPVNLATYIAGCVRQTIRDT